MGKSMKLDHLKGFIHQVFSGNPSDMMIQGVAGALGAIVSAWAEVNPFVGAYVVIVVVDTFLGVRLSQKEGRKFVWTRLLRGPGEKVIFTTVVLVAAQFMELFIPGNFLAYGIAAYMSAVLFLEMVGKYDKLTGNTTLEWVRERIGSLTNIKPAKPDEPAETP